jgi:tetratricopeptide (TPR) repeat protein
MPSWLSLLFVLVGLLATAATSTAQLPHDPPAPPTRAQLARQQAGQALDRAKALYGLGLLQRQSDQLVAALDSFTQASRLDPEALAPRRQMLPILIAFRRYDEALAQADYLLARQPDDPELWRTLGELHWSHGDQHRAIAAYERALTCTAARAQPHQWLGLRRQLIAACEQAGAPSKALEQCQALVRILQTSRQPLLDSGAFDEDSLAYELFRTHERAGENALTLRLYDEALAQFRAAQAVAEEADADEERQMRLAWRLAEVYYAQRRYAEALKLLDTYLAVRPTAMPAVERKVELLGRLGRDDEVLPMLAKLAADQPQAAALQLLYGQALARTDPAQAEPFYRQLTERLPSPSTYAGYFELLRSRGRTGKILATLDDALQTAADKDKFSAAERQRAAQAAADMIEVLRKRPALIRELLTLALARPAENDREPGADVVRTLGKLAARCDELEAAEQLYRRALTNAPLERLSDVYDGLIRVLWQQNKRQAIVTLCRQAIEREPTISAIYLRYHLSAALAELGQIDEALREAQLALAKASEPAKLAIQRRIVSILQRGERHQQAIQLCQSLLEQYKLPGQQRDIRYTLAGVYSSQKDYANAQEQLRLILRDDPDDASACNDLGYHLAEQGRHLDEAEALCRRAIELDRASRREHPDEEPDNAAFLDSLGWVCFRQGKLPQARVWLERASQLAAGRNDPTVWDHLGDVYYKMKEYGSARQAWQTALRLHTVEQPGRQDALVRELHRKLRLPEVTIQRP